MHSRQTCYLLLAIGWLAANFSLLAAETNSWRITSPALAEKTLPSLPALAVVGQRDDSGESWVLQGSISGTRQIAARDFHACFEQQGWQFDKVIPIGAGGRNGSLFLWRRDGRSIFLMLRESGVAQTDFALNLENKPRPTSTENHFKP
jgi:hypothetical protein